MADHYASSNAQHHFTICPFSLTSSLSFLLIHCEYLAILTNDICNCIINSVNNWKWKHKYTLCEWGWIKVFARHTFTRLSSSVTRERHFILFSFYSSPPLSLLVSWRNLTFFYLHLSQLSASLALLLSISLSLSLLLFITNSSMRISHLNTGVASVLSFSFSFSFSSQLVNCALASDEWDAVKCITQNVIRQSVQHQL